MTLFILGKKFLTNKKNLFLIVGAYNTMVGFMITNLLLLFTSDKLAPMVMIATYPFTLIHNFFSFEKLVFKSKIGFVKGIFRLNNSYIISAIAHIILVSIFVYIFNFNDNLTYSLSLPFLIVLQYIVHTKYTFKQ